MRRIICLGNRFLDSDAAGPKVFDCLKGMALPGRVEAVDGGLAGLNLLGLIESSRRVVFVDAVSGYVPAGGIVVLSPADLPRPEARFDHAAGLPYLLAVMPLVCNPAPSEVVIVGIEGRAFDEAIAVAARTSAVLAAFGLPDARPVSYQGGAYGRFN